MVNTIDLPNSTSDKTFQRPHVEGKFLYLGDEKFLVKGVTYGSFPPNSHGHEFPEPYDVAKDFTLMRAAGINTILTYTVPPLSLLDQAQENNLRVITVVPWMEYVCFLEESATREKMLREVQEGVASCRRHPALMMYCVGKEIPSSIVRWHGPRKVQAFLRDLYDVAKQQDPEALVTYTNFPTTEHLELSFVDVFTFNVYLHQRREFCKYLSRLQHLAGELPFVLTEFGICSFRHGAAGQANFLDWQIEEAFDHGLAGTVIFGWTDPFYQDHQLVTEWGFGLVDAERRPKLSYQAVQRRFTAPKPFLPQRKWPRMSVVVAARNAGQTLESCLESLTRLRYPDYEVIVVNDGSTDNTEEVADRFPQFTTISTPNQGVSAARNEGLRAATGEIVAYIDSDADADADWLTYLANTYLESDVAGVGGPNFVPASDNWVAKCVYRSPGGPTQVMLDDQLAEHIPGCNMSFRKSTLDELGGFDPIFRAAADDVDMCWRLLDKGYHIGFNPSAVVWHHRRPSVRAYWRQQVGYGISESILERKFPNKFNPWGHTFWAGRIYGPYPTFRLFGKPVIYQGLWGSAGFQPMYDPGAQGLMSIIPRAMEWHVALVALAVLGVFFPWALAVCALGLLYTCGYCVYCALKANLDVLETENEPATFGRRLRWRAMIALLHFLEPVARDWGRLKGGLTPWRNVTVRGAVSRASAWWMGVQPFGRRVSWTCSGTMALEKYSLLEGLSKKLLQAGCAVGWNPMTEEWDIKARRGALVEAKLRAVIEHHGGARRLARVSADMRPPRSAYWVQFVLVALSGALAWTGFEVPALLVAAAFAFLWLVLVLAADRLEQATIAAAEQVADQLQSTVTPEPFPVAQ